MAKAVIFHDIQEVGKYRDIILANLSQSVSVIKVLLEGEEPQVVFKRFKFEKVVKEPLSGEAENLIEVINQSQTYLVSLVAVEFLSFILNWGNAAGYDIEATDGTVIAECFAATSHKSNSKLTKDIKRLATNTTAEEKYEFFYVLDFTEKSRKYYEKKYVGINMVRLEQL